MSLPVWLKALLGQVGAGTLTLLAAVLAGLLGCYLPVAAWLTVHAALAMTFSFAWSLPAWWLPMQALFVPAVLFTRSLNLPAYWFFYGFVLLWLFYRGNTRERVPLYLSNRTTWRALAGLLPVAGNFAFLDLGCGLGGVLAFLCRVRPDGEFHGVESAPVPFLVSWLKLLSRQNGHVRFGDLWRGDLAAYDVVYAFLSPSPMPELWRKARAEMRPGSLLISNTFEIPGAVPDRILELDDARRTRLLIWHM